ncbi:hypothetical protein D1647_14155 [Alistipes sp. Z76]|nr:hypothetical protein [Alistipes sp. Z76]NCE69353.1 hypothetical protein [Muribaculaceae bacterium M3]
MKSNILGTLLAATVALGGLAACDNMDALYTQYMQEQTYSGKISNLQGQSGTGRVVLTWTNPEDQISKKIKIVYGDDKQEKIYETLVDEASIDGLTASAYQFTVYTMDAFGNLSVPVSISKTLYTQSHINGMEPPRCLLAKQEDGTYTLTFSGLCNSMMMFGGELKYTIRGGGYTHSDIYTETIAANALTSTFISKSFEGLELVEGETYEVEYELAVYPANMSSIGTNNTYSFSDKSIDLMTISKTVTLSI